MKKKQETIVRESLPPIDFTPYEGKTVAIRGDRIVAVADDLEELLELPEFRRDEDTIFAVPEPNSFF